MTQFINLTIHPINVFSLDKREQVLVIPPSGTEARVSTHRVQTGTINGVPIFEIEYGEIENLPPPQDGVTYIVSMLIGQRSPGRTDLYGPDSSPQGKVTSEKGQMIGTVGLVPYR